MTKLYLIPDPARLPESAELAEEWGAAFEYNDFFSPAVLMDGEETARRIRMYRSLGRDTRRDTLHGAFFDVTVHSDDPEIRAVSEKRVRQSMAAARALEVRGVVFHTNFLPNFRLPSYRSAWAARNQDFFGKLLREFPEQEIYMENMFDEEPEPLLRLAAAMAGEGRFGVCLDYAHARVFGGDPAAWLRKLAPYVRHMHINDNDGLADLHLPVGEGIIDWREYDALVRSLTPDATVLVETTGLERQRRSLAFMAREKLCPVFPKEDAPC